MDRTFQLTIQQKQNSIQKKSSEDYLKTLFSMPLKKTTSSMSHSAMPPAFRTLMKSRVNKETVKDLVQLSTAIQSTLEQADNKSVKSSTSMKFKTDSTNFGTDKIRSFVRNMKVSNKKNDPSSTLKFPRTIKANELSNSRTSILSGRSAKSQAQRLDSIKLEKELIDNKSVVSTKSLAVSECLPRTKHFISKLGEDSEKENAMERLNKLQQKIDYLVKNKLKGIYSRGKMTHSFSSKSFFGSGSKSKSIIQPRQQDEMIEKQLQQLADIITKLKIKTQQSPNQVELEKTILELDKKILLLQKIMASNSTEADMLKSFYFALKSQKYPHLSTKEKIAQEMARRKNLLKHNASMIQMRDLGKSSPIIRYESTSKQFFTRPDRSAYVDLGDRSKKFISNTQPFPRSSYNADFLNYGALPVFKCKPETTNHAVSKLHFTTSNYTDAFKTKKIELKQINYKDLDAYRDKIRLGGLSFAEMYKNKPLKIQRDLGKINKRKDNEHKTSQKQGHSSIKKAMQTLSSLQPSSVYGSSSKFMGLTEMKTEYVWPSSITHSPKQEVEPEVRKLAKAAVIKDANLDKLKASFKMQLVR